jgi:D-methionine transport system substrate-binding protein
MIKTAKAGAFCAALVMALWAAAGCTKRDANTLVIGATAQPHAKLLRFVKDDLKKKGYTLRIVEFSDYVSPNTALLNGELDANFFQHIPYLEEREDWKTGLSPVFGVHVEPFGLYSLKHKELSRLADGASIAVPNDATNGGRAYLLLQAHGLIKLRESAGLAASDLDVLENRHNYKFVALDAAIMPEMLKNVDAACINGNYALQAGFIPAKDTLLRENAASPYVNIVVVKRGNEFDPRVKALQAVMLTARLREYIEKNWPNGSVLPVF